MPNRPQRTARTARPGASRPAGPRALGALLAWLSAACALSAGAQVTDAPGALAEDTRSPTAAPAVEPVGDWLRIVDVVRGDAPVEVHLRTGYARPLILPEPVRLTSGTPPGAEVRVDDELVVLEPSAHFAARPLDFVGLESGRTYRFRVRSNTLGSRIPLRVVLP